MLPSSWDLNILTEDCHYIGLQLIEKSLLWVTAYLVNQRVKLGWNSVVAKKSSIFTAIFLEMYELQ